MNPIVKVNCQEVTKVQTYMYMFDFNTNGNIHVGSKEHKYMYTHTHTDRHTHTHTITCNSCRVSQSREKSVTPSQSFSDTVSTNHKAIVLGQVPARFMMVLRRVMYVPPMAGSLILAWNAIPDTNIEYTATYIIIRIILCEMGWDEGCQNLSLKSKSIYTEAWTCNKRPVCSIMDQHVGCI